jgi:hypothetical protein
MVECCGYTRQNKRNTLVIIQQVSLPKLTSWQESQSWAATFAVVEVDYEMVPFERIWHLSHSFSSL